MRAVYSDIELLEEWPGLKRSPRLASWDWNNCWIRFTNFPHLFLLFLGHFRYMYIFLNTYGFAISRPHAFRQLLLYGVLVRALPDAHLGGQVQGACINMINEEYTSRPDSAEGRHDRFGGGIEFITAFNQHLLSIASFGHGQKKPLPRFAQHADVQTLYRKFEELVKELRSHVTLRGAALCGSGSMSCCLRDRRL